LAVIEVFATGTVFPCGLANDCTDVLELGVAGLCITLFSEQILESGFDSFEVSESPGRATFFSCIEDDESIFAIKNSVVCVHGFFSYKVGGRSLPKRRLHAGTATKTVVASVITRVT
jgi:hypothetical protein